MGGKITKVIPGLYLGDNTNATCDQDLLGSQISSVLSVQGSARTTPLNTVTDLREIVIQPSDNYGLLKTISEANDFIHTIRHNQHRVLICSESGISTNVAVAAAYLMTVHELDRCSAISVIQAVIHAAYPCKELQFQLDIFGEVPEATAFQCNTGQSGSKFPTASSERQRLLNAFGSFVDWNNDMDHINSAIAFQKSLNEQGVLLQLPQPKLEWDADNAPLTVNFPSRSKDSLSVGDCPLDDDSDDSQLSEPPPFIPTGEPDEELFPDDPAHFLTQDVSRMKIHVPRRPTPEPLDIVLNPELLKAKPNDSTDVNVGSPHSLDGLELEDEEDDDVLDDELIPGSVTINSARSDPAASSMPFGSLPRSSLGDDFNTHHSSLSPNRKR